MEINSNPADLITKYFDELTETQLGQFQQLGELYADWNQKINVISRKDISNLYEKHILHSLAIAVVFRFVPGMQVVDIGSGGGFPAVPLAIFFPETEFIAVDSIGKKLKVVDEVCLAAGLKNLTTVHARMESIRNRRFDAAVTRAVAPLQQLLEWSRMSLNKSHKTELKFQPSGHTEEYRLASGLIALKGGDLNKEIQESGKKVFLWELEHFFTEEFFREKYLLQVPA